MSAAWHCAAVDNEGPFDVILQMSHQSHAHRVVEYHRASCQVTQPPKSVGAPQVGVGARGGVGSSVFDDLSCAGAVAMELTPRTNKTGRCLTLLSRPAATPVEFVRWLASSAVLSRRVFRVFHVRACRATAAAAASGAWLPTTVEELVAAVLAARVPAPVRLQFGPPVPGREGDHEAVGRALSAAGVVLHPRKYASVLHVVHVALDDVAAAEAAATAAVAEAAAGATAGSDAVLTTAAENVGCGAGADATTHAAGAPTADDEDYDDGDDVDDDDGGVISADAPALAPDMGYAWGWVPRDAHWVVGAESLSISHGHAAKAVAKIGIWETSVPVSCTARCCALLSCLPHPRLNGNTRTPCFASSSATANH
jgi:hypothetical protein